MKIKYLKFKNWVLVSLMGMLGMQACHSHKKVTEGNLINIDEPSPRPERERYVEMYGVPAREYRVNPVVDEDSTMTNDGKGNNTFHNDEPVLMYGVPTVDFMVKGRVVDEKGKPIKGVQVMLLNSDVDADNLPETEHWKARLREVSDTTDADGNFEVRTSDRPWETVRVMARDIDGKANGLYESTVVEPEFIDAEKADRPMSQWKLGEKKAEVTVKMKKK